MEEHELLLAFVTFRLEIALMGFTDVGEYGYRGLDNVAQSKHLARLTDAGLEHAYFRLLVHEPHGKGHTYLRIVAPGRTGDTHLRRKELIEPLFHHRLAIGAGDAYNGNVKLITMTFGQALQRFKRVHHPQKVGIRIIRSTVCRHFRHHKVLHAPPIKFRNVVVSVIAFGFEGEKKCFFGKA